MKFPVFEEIHEPGSYGLFKDKVDGALFATNKMKQNPLHAIIAKNLAWQPGGDVNVSAGLTPEIAGLENSFLGKLATSAAMDVDIVTVSRVALYSSLSDEPGIHLANDERDVQHIIPVSEQVYTSLLPSEKDNLGKLADLITFTCIRFTAIGDDLNATS